MTTKQRIVYIGVVAAAITSCTRVSDTPQKKVLKDLSTVNVYLTSKESSDRLTQRDHAIFQDAVSPVETSPSVIVDYTKTFQTIVGIGGAFTDASAETFYKLPRKNQEEIITAYFDIDKGIGYSLGRTHINSCDFSSESYSYVQTADTTLSAFSIAHDQKFRIPFIKEALQKSGNKMKLFASPWSPPAWMKSNNNMLHGGKLKSEYYGTWARYYIKFLEAYRKEGINFWGLTVQNEPLATQTWESCIYSAEEERDFVRNHLGPVLQGSEFSDLKLMVWDHNRDIILHRAKVIFDDPEAAKYIWGAAFHWYMGDHYENIQRMHEAYPDKELVFSEGCGSPFNWENVNDWHWGEKYAEAMIHDFNNWTVAWTDWNILLDETGGPNHVQNFCLAPIIGDTRDGSVHYMNSYYYIGHFSKFIRPGAKRISCSSTSDDLETTAFINTNNQIVTVVLNKTDDSRDFTLCIDGKGAKINLPAHSIVTCTMN
jgi:glucosylceramidase